MKNISFLTLFVISFSVVGISQTITFYKSYPYNGSSGLKPSNNILQADDGGYIIHNQTEFRFIKTDQFGYIEQVKEFPDYKAYSLKLIKTFDGGYATVGNAVLDTNSIVLIKLDQNLDTIWTKSYTRNSGDEAAQEIIQLQDSNYIFSSGDLYESTYYLRKTDVNGSLIWEKETEGPPALFNFSYLVNLSNNNFLFYKPLSLIKMNSDGDTLWSRYVTRSNFSYLTSDGYILCHSGNTLQKIDQDSNLIWQKDIINPNSITENNNGNYVCVARSSSYPELPNRILVLDTAGNQISQTDFVDEVTNIISCEDGGLAISGKLYGDFRYGHYPIWLLKTDNDLNYTAIQLRTPIDSQTLNIFGTYDFKWNSKNVNFVNLDYSVDNQISWIPIIHYHPADTYLFNWALPSMPQGDLFIRISDSFNSDIYDRSDPPQTAINYQSTDYISTNEIFMWIGNNGMGSHNPYTDADGFFWPGGDSATIPAVFADGLVWGGKVNGEIRVNGNTYRYGLKPGRILEDGTADNPLSTQSKIFKIRKDWQTLPESVLKDRLEFDYNHWPIEAGAPWDDVNEDGVYTPGFDKPKFIGDETLFYVANDLDTARSLYTYGSNPIGLEFQTTVFGFNREDLKDVVFKKYRVINKNNTDITDMYFTYWADVDLGYAIDDLSAFDSTYNMAYVYNFDNDDGYGYYGTPPPAIAHMIVQGPIFPANSYDSARYEDSWKKGFKNLEMTSAGLIVKSQLIYPNDPDLGVYAGTIHFYNLMQGLNNDGSDIVNPLTNEPTIWPLTGDPVTGTGWYLVYPGMNYGFDQRYHVPTGPFNLAAGDTQEIVIAIPIARGSDNINSITKLRELAAHVQEFYNTEFVEILNTKETIAPTGFTLYQNYPNPFNPKTTIEYEIPEKTNVTIKIYDILGKEVKTLVDNEEKVRWKYKVEFNASTLSSGVYFYRIQAGSFTQTKKMMVLK